MLIIQTYIIHFLIRKTHVGVSRILCKEEYKYLTLIECDCETGKVETLVESIYTHDRFRIMNLKSSPELCLYRTNYQDIIFISKTKQNIHTFYRKIKKQMFGFSRLSNSL